MASDRPKSLCILNSICFIESEDSLGLVYRLPDNVSLTVQPMSLHTLLNKSMSGFRPPDLDKRIRLAQQLATSIYSFSLVRWFHKDFNSRNIVFFRSASLPGKVTLESPFIVGFSISRPDAENEKSLNKDTNALAIYLHPDLRVDNPSQRAPYHRKYDIYSLGLVLFEIGFWKSLDNLCDTALDPDRFKQSVIDRCTKHLGFYTGPRYRDVVLHCLKCADDGTDSIASHLDTLYWSVVIEIARLN